ncbi:hypothetical protein KC19_5G164300 [Ceratodon purpureus]|uniref:DNA-binding protein RHL1 n=1 Tax=Ceratodon purpureus TaxID=3225 RepID=A0A8T0I3F1_CERPU|nr:hypothetical protein KC19_5G164300 [Ceratodon purpureus]
MAPKKRVEVVVQSREDKGLEKESKRLRELAVERGLLGEKRDVPEESFVPHAGILRCDGKDICKKGHRKNKYLFSFPGLVAPVAGGKFGDLSQLDSRNPVLYVDFPQGRLKLFGTIVYPKNKYITLNFVRGAGSIQCEDLFESLVVFSEVWWIGTKVDNPDELRLDMPLDLQQEKHSVYDFAGGAGRPKIRLVGVDVPPSQLEPVQASQLESSKLSTPKAQLKMDQWLSQKKSVGRKTSEKTSESNAKAKIKIADEWESDEEDEGFVNLGDIQTPSRQSARTVGKKYSYVESSSEENGTDDSGGDNDLGAETREFEGKNTNNLFMSNYAEDGVLVPESQASKMDLTDPLNGYIPTDLPIAINGLDDKETTVTDHLAASQNSAPKSTAGAVSKQSSLSAFFIKSNEKKGVNVQPPVSVADTGTTRTYQRTKVTKTTLEVAVQEDASPTSKTEMKSVLPETPSESNGSKRKRKATSEGKQTPKGSNLLCSRISFVLACMFSQSRGHIWLGRLNG